MRQEEEEEVEVMHQEEEEEVEVMPRQKNRAPV